jgi:predicted nucleic acid-binding protein
VPFLIDATVISNFAAVGRLDLLREHLGSAFLADTVYDELIRGSTSGFAFLADIRDEMLEFSETGWLRRIRPTNDAERRAFERLATMIDLGEAMSLAIVGERGWLFLTDDREAREVADQADILTSGTVGVLIGLVLSGTLTLDEANALLGDMIVRARFRSPVTDLRQVEW